MKPDVVGLAHPIDLPDDANHALLVGSIIGLVMRAQADGTMTVKDVHPIMDGDNYSTSFVITMPSGKYTVTVSRDPIEEEPTLS